jgi:hypothetical protein
MTGRDMIDTDGVLCIAAGEARETTLDILFGTVLASPP